MHTFSDTRVVLDADDPHHVARALEDIASGLLSWQLAWRLALLDLRNRYRGSVLGPLWVTLSMTLMIGGLGILYAQLFRIDIALYLPHLAIGLIVWNWIAGSLNESCHAFTGSAPMIRQLRIPYSVHVLRCVLRNVLTAAHSLPVIVVVMLIFWRIPGPEGVLALVGLGLITLNIAAAAFFLGMLCARFRDVPQIVANVVQLSFFLTPVLWKAELLGEHASWLFLNPFYTLLETVRAPLIGGGGELSLWLAALGYTALNVMLAALAFVRFRARIAFWV